MKTEECLSTLSNISNIINDTEDNMSSLPIRCKNLSASSCRSNETVVKPFNSIRSQNLRSQSLESADAL